MGVADRTKPHRNCKYGSDMRRALFVILLLGCKELRPMFSEPVVYSISAQTQGTFLAGELGVAPDKCSVASALSCSPDTPSRFAVQRYDVAVTQHCQLPVRNFSFIGNPSLRMYAFGNLVGHL